MRKDGLNIINLFFKNNNISLICRLLSFLILSFAFIYYFAITASPASLYSGGDYGIFVTMGQYWAKKGNIYSGLFDNKGPYHFLIQLIGLKIYYDKWGIFLLEVINLTLCLSLLYKIGNLFNSTPILNYFGIVAFLSFLAITLYGGDTVEEWSLPFVLIPLYFSIKFILGNKQEHPPIYGFIYGLSFAIISFMRINNNAINVGIILGLTYLLLKNKKYKNFFSNVATFLLGVIVGTLPVILYFWVKGSLYDMLYATFLYNIKYRGVWDINDKSMYHNITRMSILILILIETCFYDKKYHRNLLPIISSSVLILFITFLQGAAHLHYLTMMLPLIYITVILLPYLKKWFSIIVIVGYFYLISNDFYIQLRLLEITRTICLNPNPNAKTLVSECFSDIPPVDYDSIYTFDINTFYTDIFFSNNILPIGKYYTQQSKMYTLDTYIYNDILQNFEKANPKWVISSTKIQCSILNKYRYRYQITDSISVSLGGPLFLYRRK